MFGFGGVCCGSGVLHVWLFGCLVGCGDFVFYFVVVSLLGCWVVVVVQ